MTSSAAPLAPYGTRLDPSVHEVRILLGLASAWRRARNEAAAGLRRSIVWEMEREYRLPNLRGRCALIVALDGATRRDVFCVAREALRAGACHAAAISPQGRFRMFRAEE